MILRRGLSSTLTSTHNMETDQVNGQPYLSSEKLLVCTAPSAGVHQLDRWPIPPPPVGPKQIHNRNTDAEGRNRLPVAGTCVRANVAANFSIPKPMMLLKPHSTIQQQYKKPAGALDGSEFL